MLANLAAVLRRQGSVDDVTEDDWDFQHDTNLKADVLPGPRRGQRDDRRVAMAGGSSCSASQGWWTGGFGGSVVYAATKGGVTTLCRGLARTYGPHRITVNCVSPGQVHTPMLMTGLAPETTRR